MGVVRQAHHERILFLVSTWRLSRFDIQGNRILKPSFRRKPESRTFGSRYALFPEDFLDSGFRRNDGCLGCRRLPVLPWLRRDCLGKRRQQLTIRRGYRNIYRGNGFTAR